MFFKIIKKLKTVPAVRTMTKKLKGSNKLMGALKKMSKPKKRVSLRSVDEKLDAINFKLDLLMDYYFDPAKARKAFGERAKRQKITLDMAIEFKRICDKYGITYWLDYGSLLGAKRHGGFIPWDEDIDVSMLFSDIKSNADKIESELSPDYKFRLNGDEYAQIFHKSGLYLDIYGYEQNGDRLKMKLFTFLSPEDMRSVPASIILPTSEIEFEGIKFKAPADVDTYLRGRFGDYEVLPKSRNPYSNENIGKRIIFYPDEKL